MQEYWKRNKERGRVYKRSFYAKHRERLLAARRLRYATSTDVRERFKRYNKEWRLKRLFGITQTDYNNMLADQGGKCAICQQPNRALGKIQKPYALAVDHSHDTGKVRGLLCNRCNPWLGWFEDNQERIMTHLAKGK